MFETSALADVLADHPRILGALLALCVLLTQAGAVAAGNGTTVG